MSSEPIERVRVSNRNQFAIKDRHDGVPYDFPPGESVVIPTEAAIHIFGWPGDEEFMAQYMARRFGWNRPEYFKIPKDEQSAQELGVPFPSYRLPWQELTRNVRLAVEKYEIRRVRAPEEPIPAEEADEAPDALGLNIDPPQPRRTVVGRRRKGNVHRKVRTRQLATASGPLEQSATEPSTFVEIPKVD